MRPIQGPGIPALCLSGLLLLYGNRCDDTRPDAGPASEHDSGASGRAGQGAVKDGGSGAVAGSSAAAGSGAIKDAGPAAGSSAVKDAGPAAGSGAIKDAGPAAGSGGGKRCGTRGGVTCSAGQFCNFEPDTDCGATDKGGVCEANPQTCTEQYQPVCGCDHRTHGNLCAAHAAGVSVLHTGACTEIDCAAAGGKVVTGIGPAPVCPAGTTKLGSVVFSNGMIPIEGADCCVPTTLQWYETCGGPVCNGDDGLTPACTSQTAGQACAPNSPECALNNGCNAHLRCTDTDPKASSCPKSRAEYKQNISYLNDAQLAQYHAEVLELKLAHYAYRADPTHEQHLGFVIEDVEPATYVEEARDRVDLYAYTSAIVAAVKVQDKRIQELEHKVRTLSKQLTKAKAAQRPASSR